jgi:hypothetical protein
VVDHIQLDLVADPGLVQFFIDELGGERRGIERYTQFLREIGDCADVILVRVGQDDPDQVLLALLDEIQVCENQFGAGVLVGPEGHAKVHHQPLALAAVEVDIHPDFARAAERAKQQFLARFHESMVRLA